MANTYNPYSQGADPTTAALYANNNAQYMNRAAQGGSLGSVSDAVAKSGALVQGTFGIPAEKVGLSNLYKMLLDQGRVDPRLLARAQALNARQTQQQQDAARAGAARSGIGGGGLNQAIQGAIGAAGSTRSSNLNYQDIADAYGRNQQNLGLLDQLVIQPQLGYGNLAQQDLARRDQLKAAKLGAYGSLLGSAAKAVGGG